jgi:hypothetical protein
MTVKPYKYLLVKTCRDCPIRGVHQERDEQTQEKNTVFSCWAYDYGYKKEMEGNRGRTIPVEIGEEGYPDVPGWCPLPDHISQTIKVLDEMIKVTMMIGLNEEERWEREGRPKNDGYINGSHSGYNHALRDVRRWIDIIKNAELRQKDGEK